MVGSASSLQLTLRLALINTARGTSYTLQALVLNVTVNLPELTELDGSGVSGTTFSKALGGVIDLRGAM